MQTKKFFLVVFLGCLVGSPVHTMGLIPRVRDWFYPAPAVTTIPSSSTSPQAVALSHEHDQSALIMEKIRHAKDIIGHLEHVCSPGVAQIVKDYLVGNRVNTSFTVNKNDLRDLRYGNARPFRSLAAVMLPTERAIAFVVICCEDERCKGAPHSDTCNHNAAFVVYRDRETGASIGIGPRQMSSVDLPTINTTAFSTRLDGTTIQASISADGSVVTGTIQCDTHPDEALLLKTWNAQPQKLASTRSMIAPAGPTSFYTTSSSSSSTITDR